MGKLNYEKKWKKKNGEKGKEKWKMIISNLKKRKNFFIKHYNRTIDDETKWIIEFIVRNFQDFIKRNRSQYDCFEKQMSKICVLNEGIRQENRICFNYWSYMDRMFIMSFLILNAEVMRIELKKSLKDMRFRYPRCSHLEMKVNHSLFVLPDYYFESTDKDYVRFFICDDCKDYIDFCGGLWEEFWELGGCNGRNFEKNFGFVSVTPLQISMY